MPSQIKPEDIKKLIGKEFDFIHDDGSSEKAILLEADENIGFTIISAEQKDEYLYCCYGPAAHKAAYKKEMSNSGKEEYTRKFNLLMSLLEAGKDVDISDFLDLSLSYDDASSEVCAFNQ